MKFLLIALTVALVLFGIGYYPAVGYDPTHGPKSLIYGLGLAVGLMVPSYFTLFWAMRKSQRVFLITFGAGFILRLVLLVALFILYWIHIKERDFCFALSFGVAYLLFSLVEVFLFKSAFSQKKSTGEGSP